MSWILNDWNCASKWDSLGQLKTTEHFTGQCPSLTTSWSFQSGQQHPCMAWYTRPQKHLWVKITPVPIFFAIPFLIRRNRRTSDTWMLLFLGKMSPIHKTCKSGELKCNMFMITRSTFALCMATLMSKSVRSDTCLCLLVERRRARGYPTPTRSTGCKFCPCIFTFFHM